MTRQDYEDAVQIALISKDPEVVGAAFSVFFQTRRAKKAHGRGFDKEWFRQAYLGGPLRKPHRKGRHLTLVRTDKSKGSYVPRSQRRVRP